MKIIQKVFILLVAVSLLQYFTIVKTAEMSKKQLEQQRIKDIFWEKRFKESDLGINLYNLLGTSAFDTKDGLLRARISFNKDNKFSRKELVILNIDGFFIYSIILDIIKVESKNKFMCLIQTYSNKPELVDFGLVGKIIQESEQEQLPPPSYEEALSSSTVPTIARLPESFHD